MKITPKKYAQALAGSLEASEDPKQIIQNFLKLLRRRKQSRLLPKVLQAFEQEWASRRGIVKCRVSYPEKFPDSVAELGRRLSEKLGKKLEITESPSPNLIGGFRVQVEDTLIDASIEAWLRALNRHLN